MANFLNELTLKFCITNLFVWFSFSFFFFLFCFFLFFSGQGSLQLGSLSLKTRLTSSRVLGIKACTTPVGPILQIIIESINNTKHRNTQDLFFFKTVCFFLYLVISTAVFSISDTCLSLFVMEECICATGDKRKKHHSAERWHNPEWTVTFLSEKH